MFRFQGFPKSKRFSSVFGWLSKNQTFWPIFPFTFLQGVSVNDWTREEKLYLQTHLLNGIGHYHNFLMWVQTSFAVSQEKNEDGTATLQDKNACGSATADFDFSQVKAFETELISGKLSPPLCDRLQQIQLEIALVFSWEIIRFDYLKEASLETKFSIE